MCDGEPINNNNSMHADCYARRTTSIYCILIEDSVYYLLTISRSLCGGSETEYLIGDVDDVRVDIETKL